MKAEIKFKISLIFNVILLFSLCVAVANIGRYYSHNQYHRNRMLDYEFEKHFLSLYPNNSLQYFQNKWGDELEYNPKFSYYSVDESTIIKEPFFVKNNYFKIN